MAYRNLGLGGGASGGGIIRREEEKWKKVPCRQKGAETSGKEAVPVVLASRICPFNVYQVSPCQSKDSMVKQINTVLNSGIEMKELLEEVSLEVYSQLLIILRGCPGSGKSTLANVLLAITKNGTICSADSHFMQKGKYVFRPSELGTAHGRCQEKCKNLMEKCVSPVIIDNTNTKRFEIEPYIKYAVRYNYKVRIVEPETPWKTDAKTLAVKTIHEVPRKKIEEMLNRFERIITQSVVNDVRKQMGEIGERYSPTKNDKVFVPVPIMTDIEQIELSNAFTNQLDLNQCRRRQVKVGIPIPTRSLTPPSGTLRKDTKLSDFLLEPSNASSSISSEDHGLDKKYFEETPRRKAAAVFPSGFQESISDSIVRTMSPVNEKQNDNQVSKLPIHSTLANVQDLSSPNTDNDGGSDILNHSNFTSITRQPLVPSSENPRHLEVQTLKSLFPLCDSGELLDLLEKCGDIDDATSLLLDSGYCFTQDTQVFEDDIERGFPIRFKRDDNYKMDKWDESLSDSLSDIFNFEEHEMKDDWGEDINELKMKCDCEICTRETRDEACERKQVPDDATFPLTLPREVISKLVEKFSFDPTDPVIDIMLEEPAFTAELPSTTGFKIYDKVMDHAMNNMNFQCVTENKRE